jgi:hypothetical protein
MAFMATTCVYSYLIAIDMACRLDRNDVRELSEDLVEDRAVVLSIGVLVELQLDKILDFQGLPGHGVAVKLLEVGDDVAARRDQSCQELRTPLPQQKQLLDRWKARSRRVSQMKPEPETPPRS